MGGNDHCAVYGCSNTRNRPERLVRKDHIGILRWHSPRSKKDMQTWQKMLNRGGRFKMSMSTKVCSNHFAAGYCSDVCPIPTLFLKGYEEIKQPKRKHLDRANILSPPKKKRVCYRNGFDENAEKSLPEITTPYVNEHNYDTLPYSSSSGSARSASFVKCSQCSSKDKIISELLKTIDNQKSHISKLQNDVDTAKEKGKSFDIDDISHSEKLVKIYTGLQNAKLFDWLYEFIMEETEGLQYYDQSSNQKRRMSRKLNSRKAFFLVLVKLRLGLSDNDLSYRFSISQSTVSVILNSWLPFLSNQFSAFICWPSREDNENAYPKCFKNFPNTIGIIDCTEGAIEKPSLARAQAQTYSTYKSKNTWKVLICITPCGTVSFVSKIYGGCASDRYITETCGIMEKINPGDTLMADKGFNISDLLINKCSKLVIPPFLKDKGKFSHNNATKTSKIAKARIHVERAIARIKDFKILQNTIPLSRKDKLDDILIICCALTNLAPPLVPL